MGKETTKTKKERKVKMYPTSKTYKDSNGMEHTLTAEQIAENRIKNVKDFAVVRLNKTAKSIEVFGQCCGSAYDWSASKMTPEQIKALLYSKVDAAIAAIESGSKAVNAGITL